MMYCSKNETIGGKALSRFAFGVYGLVGSTLVMAQDAVDTIDVSATVVAAVASCAVDIGSIDFGDIEAGEATSIGDYDQNFNMNFQCSEAVTGATATFDGGLNVSSSGSIRRMAGPNGAFINYTINEPPSLLISVGETLTFDLSSGTSSDQLVALVNAQTIPTELGNYTDTITVTFTF